MITIKLPIQTDITEYLKQYNNIVRFAYNRFQDNKDIKLSQVESIVKSKMNNLSLMDATLIKSACDNARDRIKDNKIVFGGKHNWKQYNKGLITKEQYRLNKLRPLTVKGDKPHKGNPKFQLDIIQSNEIIFKPNRKIHIRIKLPETSHNFILKKLQQLCEEGKAYFNCSLTNEFIYIHYDEAILSEEKHIPIKNRILSIDLNPNYTSFVICDYDKKERKNILHKEIIHLYDLYKQSKNKIHHELYEVNKYIINLAKHYQCESLVLEKLSIDSNDKKKGKQYNKMCNNDWRRRIVISNLLKYCNVVGVIYQEVIPQYSSFIGQIDNEEEYDSIAAALELGRRGNIYIRAYIKKEVEFEKGSIIKVGESLSVDLMDRWKKKLNFNGDLSTYHKLYNLIKKLKYNYRLLFPGKTYRFSLRLSSNKSYVNRVLL